MAKEWRSLDEAVGELREELGITIPRKQVIESCENKSVRITKIGFRIMVHTVDFVQQFDSIAADLRTKMKRGLLNNKIDSLRYQLNCRSTMGAVCAMIDKGGQQYTGDQIFRNIEQAINKGL